MSDDPIKVEEILKASEFFDAVFPRETLPAKVICGKQAYNIIYEAIKPGMLYERQKFFGLDIYISKDFAPYLVRVLNVDGKVLKEFTLEKQS